MARFDVYTAPDGSGYLLDCQADLLGDFDTRFTVPLLPASGAKAATRLHPIFDVNGEKVVMVTQLALAVPVKILDRPVTSLADRHGEIMNALDMLLTGY
ncbi:CcdB family protein [Sphingomonas cavernae]|uniref:Toxin CcdB n=1 Tax=Sphingomonas cavernae TaxID=2320861 RepID=A0A418WLJ4_9SPHN|nr:CcdB family protein [Sphingomonas cavernae]RJF90916.1 plasmid maintenance protein CcdB [Sphingomonas cavernae]